MANDEKPPLSASTTLPLHADAAAFLPRGPCSASSPHPLLLAVATYELLVAAERNERRGGIHLFDASGGELTPLGGVGSGEGSAPLLLSRESLTSNGCPPSEKRETAALFLLWAWPSRTARCA